MSIDYKGLMVGCGYAREADSCVQRVDQGSAGCFAGAMPPSNSLEGIVHRKAIDPEAAHRRGGARLLPKAATTQIEATDRANATPKTLFPPAASGSALGGGRAAPPSSNMQQQAKCGAVALAVSCSAAFVAFPTERPSPPPFIPHPRLLTCGVDSRGYLRSDWIQKRSSNQRANKWPIDSM